MAAQLREKEISQKLQLIGISPETHQQMDGHCDYIQKLFTQESGPKSSLFDTYLTNFSRLDASERARRGSSITEDNIWAMLKKLGTDKTLESVAFHTK